VQLSSIPAIFLPHTFTKSLRDYLTQISNAYQHQWRFSLTPKSRRSAAQHLFFLIF